MAERNHLLNPPIGEFRNDRIESLLCPVPGQVFLFEDRDEEASHDLVRSITETTERWKTRAVA